MKDLWGKNLNLIFLHYFDIEKGHYNNPPTNAWDLLQYLRFNTTGGLPLMLELVVTADANTVSRRVLIQGLDYTGTNRNSYINTTPGGVATGTQLYATVSRMRIEGPTVGEKITITKRRYCENPF